MNGVTTTMTNGGHHHAAGDINLRTLENPYFVSSSDRIAIIGAGVAGIAMASALQNASYSNFIVYDQQSNMGGLWLQNYPNIAGKSFCYF